MDRNQIVSFIEDYINEYETRDEIATVYGRPLVGFADAYHPYVQELPRLISPAHDLPQNVISDAKIIIAYYIPFTKDLAKTNTAGRMASPEWARAYEETNALFAELNDALIRQIRAAGGSAAVSPKAAVFSEEELISCWSQRHIAYAAGLGTFGVNNMLITKYGCCGRYSSVITNLPLEPDSPVVGEYCLYKKNGSCGVCLKNCPTGALDGHVFDRFRCNVLCRENARIYTQFGTSYMNEDGTPSGSEGSDVCGKCITGSPCAFRNPGQTR